MQRANVIICGPVLASAWGIYRHNTNPTTDAKKMAMMAVSSSYSLESAPCPAGSGWKHAALSDASPAPSPAGSAAAAVQDAAPSPRVPADVSWPGAPAEAESHKSTESI